MDRIIMYCFSVNKIGDFLNLYLFIKFIWARDVCYIHSPEPVQFRKELMEIKNLFGFKDEKESMKRCMDDNLLIVSRVNPQETNNVEVENK